MREGGERTPLSIARARRVTKIKKKVVDMQMISCVLKEVAM